MKIYHFFANKTLYNFFIAVITVLLCNLPNEVMAQKPTSEPFEIYFDYIQKISDYHKQFPHVEFVYGNPNSEESGHLVIIEPHPENAWDSPLHKAKVSNYDFRVWIDAEQIEEKEVRTPFSLFSKNGQSLRYLDVHRKNKSAFALFISRDEIIERIPHIDTDIHNDPVFDYRLNFHFARSLTAKWPTEYAESVTRKQTSFDIHSYPSTYFLKNEGEWVCEAHLYMDKHPEKKYFFDKEVAWGVNGWFFNLSYRRKYEIKEKINDNHYVILTFWKDKEHTKPLNISRLKESLFIGSLSMNPDEMEESLNYVAYPHKGFDDWTLLVPWTSINYWWKDGIIPTKDNHTCYGYYTLTLSNDGITPADNHSFDYSGYIALDMEYDETPKVTKKCPPHNIFYDTHKLTNHATPITEGCMREFERYQIQEHCAKCNKIFSSVYYDIPREYHCIEHNLKEIKREFAGNITINNENKTIKKSLWKITEKCQNDCCNQISTRDTIDQVTEEYQNDNHNQINTQNTTIIEDQMEKQTCPPHDYWFHSKLEKIPEQVIEVKDMKPAYNEESLKINLDSTSIEMKRTSSYTYLSSLPANRQQWINLYKDNNYMGFSKEDIGLLTGITYQEVIDFIDKLNDRQNGDDTSIAFSLPSVDEMRAFLNKNQLHLEKYELVQKINYFYVDSIEVYDGKGRKVTEEQLSTAPEGAKVHILVGCMDKNGQVKMVDITSYNNETAFYLKAITLPTKAFNVLTYPGKYRRVYYRTCRKCGKMNIISKSLFYNMRYHRPFIDNYNNN